ncbi:hypothetical protein QYM36_013003, partial [Artemia franciscana]
MTEFFNRENMRKDIIKLKMLVDKDEETKAKLEAEKLTSSKVEKVKKGKTYELEVMPAEKRVKDEPKLEPHRVEQKEQKSGLEGEQKRKLFNYQQYLAREGRKNLGSNEIPEGTEGCLTGLTFVITGVLDSLELDQTEELVRKYGRKATHSVSGKTNFIVVDVFPEPVESGITRMEDVSEEDFERLHPWVLSEVIALFERH